MSLDLGKDFVGARNVKLEDMRFIRIEGDDRSDEEVSDHATLPWRRNRNTARHEKAMAGRANGRQMVPRPSSGGV